MARTRKRAIARRDEIRSYRSPDRKYLAHGMAPWGKVSTILLSRAFTGRAREDRHRHRHRRCRR
jgi:hypothetical protein